MLDLTGWDRPPTQICPQITLIDADNVTQGSGLHLRYLRHLRGNNCALKLAVLIDGRKLFL
jgi:hypothetical protein